MLGKSSVAEFAVCEDNTVAVAVVSSAASWQGVEARPAIFRRGAAGWANYLKPSVFWAPTELRDINITESGWQGSNVRPLQWQPGPLARLNALRPTVWWTALLDQDRGITSAAFQGSNVRPKPNPARLNYLFPNYWQQAEPVAKFFFINTATPVVFSFFPFSMTFGVSCEYQPELPPVGVFIAEAPLVGEWSAEAAMSVEWSSDGAYCTEGNKV